MKLKPKNQKRREERNRENTYLRILEEERERRWTVRERSEIAKVGSGNHTNKRIRDYEKWSGKENEMGT